jgi:hypothetical protein
MIGSHPLKTFEQERDLRVVIDYELAFNSHIAATFKKANQILGLIKLNFRHLNAYCLLHLYKALVWSILEYAQPAWSPHLIKHIQAIQKVQQHATKILPNIRKLP